MVQKLKNWVGFSFVLMGMTTGEFLKAQGPAIAAPVNNWSYLRHSSTLVEGALRGQAAVISSAGETVYYDSLASVNYAEAHKRAIENSVALTQAYYDRREIREEYNKKYGPKPFVGEARRKAIEYYQPKRLSAQEYDPKANRIAWPHILRQEQFEAIVSQIDETFSSRTPSNSGDGSSTHRTLLQLCNALNGILRENIANVTADQYITAREFIRSVELEGRMPASTELQTKAETQANSETQVNAEKEVEPAKPAPKVDSDSTAKSKARSRLKV